MKKKALLVTVAAMLVMCFVCSGAFAATKGEIKQLYRKVDNANKQIQVYIKVAMLTPHDDVDRLLDRVDATVKPVFAYAESIGATIACEYETYYIDGQTVMIDPLKVINVGTGN